MLQESKYYISALYLSFFSRSFYARLIGGSNILGLKYLLLIAIILAVPVSVQIKNIISGIFATEGFSTEENLDYIASQLPKISIKGGKINISAEVNQTITAKDGTPIAILDVEDTVADISAYQGILVVNSEGVRIGISGGEQMAIINSADMERSLSQYMSATSSLNNSKLFADIKQIVKTPYLIIAIFVSGWFFLNYLISALSYSFVAGFVMSLMCRGKPFNFKQCFRIAVFTVTPVALIELISNSYTGILFSHVSVVYFITHLVYIHFAVESYKRSER